MEPGARDTIDKGDKGRCRVKKNWISLHTDMMAIARA